MKDRGEVINDEVLWSSYGPCTYVELDNNANLAVINNQLKNFIQKISR